MGHLVIINKNPAYSNHCDHGCCCTHTDINDTYFDRIMETDCPMCIKKFIEDVCYLGLFKHYWKPLTFRRNVGVFGYDTNKYDLKLEVQIEDGYKNKYFISRFHAAGRLIIMSKKNSQKYKEVDLFSFHCGHNEKELAEAYVDKIKRFMETVFAIDLYRWTEILGSKDHFERINPNFQHNIMVTPDTFGTHKHKRI